MLAAPPACNAQAASSKSAKRSVPLVPYGFVLGKTTLAEAEATWEAEKSTIVLRGHAAMGAGSGRDRVADLSADKIYLVDFQSVEFEGIRPARFVFFDGVLFSVQSVLSSILDTKKATNAVELSDEELRGFEKTVRQQYGPPNHAYRDFSAGKQPNILVWDYGNDTFTLAINAFPRSQITYSNTAHTKKAETYKNKLCRSIKSCGGG